nr:transposase [Kangiella profundi]
MNPQPAQQGSSSTSLSKVCAHSFKPSIMVKFGYYHVSDKYIALFSHFIPCGVHEAIYILDGLLKNESQIQPDTLHGDTQAQSTPVFGLAYLLGINLR